MIKTILIIAIIISGLFISHQLKADDKLPIADNILSYDVFLHSIKKGLTEKEYTTEKTRIKDKITKNTPLKIDEDNDEWAEYVEMLNKGNTKKKIDINGEFKLVDRL